MPPLDFPANPVDGQLYQDFIYDATVGVWRAQASGGGFPITVANGGTGATTVAGAQDNLGVGLVNILPTTITPTGGSYSVSGSRITFTTCTDIRLIGLFNSSFSHYKIILSLTGSSTTAGVNARLITGTTPLTSSYNYSRATANAIGGLSGAGAESQGQHVLGLYFTGSTYFNSVMDVLNPNQASLATGIHSVTGGIRGDGGFQSDTVISSSPASARDGILFLASGGNISGTIQCFGYNF